MRRTILRGYWAEPHSLQVFHEGEMEGVYRCVSADQLGSLWELQGVLNETLKPDLVNHPPHYTSHPSGIECIQVTRHMNFNIGNAMKYLWRADEKGDAIQNLEKAIWYIKDEIERRKNNGT